MAAPISLFNEENQSLGRFATTTRAQVSSEELDLGIVDLIDVKLEQLKHQDMQLARAK